MTYALAEPHEIWSNDTEAKIKQQRDLVSPPCRDVWPAMDLEEVRIHAILLILTAKCRE